MDLSLIVNGLDLHEKLSTYAFKNEVAYPEVITTLDQVEHPYPSVKRAVISFSLFPMTDMESSILYDALSDLIFDATFQNPHANAVETKRVRLVSDLESVFALLSIDGNRRYNGGVLQLREL
ncbi:MAG: hypothetical protein K2P22_11370 [Lachnospiraceae bacterium]|nr:hypothetical protein [Lachnospiraceae bacterium]